jgi:hypothetical protein
MKNLGRKAHVCVSVCLSSSAATPPFKERSKTQRGTKKCWRLFQKVFFFFSFFATRIQQKPNIKAGPERDRNKGLCVCVCVCVCVHYCYRNVCVGGSQIPHTQIRCCCCCCCKWVVASPGCCNTCYGPRGCSRLLCLQRFDTSAACYFELTIPCALTRAHTHKKRETQKATYKAAVQQQAGANASPM